MKNYGAKIFNDKKKLERLIKKAKSGKYSAPQLANFFNCARTTILGIG